VVLVAGGELIHFELSGDRLRPYLEGAVDTIYKGEYFWKMALNSRARSYGWFLFQKKTTQPNAG
jgi:hypothetical protein